ncbi:MAG: DUF2306 domain-containing protein [Gemmatimonadaceae bacterium]|nr:DUF2306 domain-containing protein [Gemmatimonadaceae bacterium]
MTRKDYLIPAGLILLSLVPSVAGTARLVEMAGDPLVTEQNARFLASPLPILLHIPAVVLYSIVGAFQFSPGLRRQKRGWHRASGRLMLPMGIVAALTGLWMAHFYAWPAGDGYMVYGERLIVGTAMLASLVLGADAIRRRDFKAHGDWMIRAYALGLGAGTQVLTHLPWFILMEGWPSEGPRGVMMGGAWLLNALVAESIIRKSRVPQPRPVAMAPLTSPAAA